MSNKESDITSNISEMQNKTIMEYLPSEILDAFMLYYVPFIIIFGLVGNLLSFLVFIFTHLRMRSSSYYLAALALSDSGFLLSLGFVWLQSVNVNVFNEVGWCQILLYLTSVFSFLSVWLIVAFTVERFIAVQYPLHRPHMCTVSRAKSVIIGLTLFSMCAYSYTLWVADVLEREGTRICDIKEEYNEAMSIINSIDTTATFIIPFIAILFLNMMIVRQLVSFSNKCRITSFNGQKSRRSSIMSTRTQVNITKMLLLISTVFVILNLPSYAIRLHVFITFIDSISSSELYFVQQFFQLVYYTTFSVNFLLYSVCGANFRRALLKLCKEKVKISLRKQNSENSNRYQ